MCNLRQSRLADEETIEWKRLEAERAAGGARGTLFEADEIQAFAARNRLQFMEKYFLGALSVLLVIFFTLVVVLHFVTSVIPNAQIQKPRALISMTFLFALTFVLFLIATYAAGMARQRIWRPLRAGAGYMMLSVLFSAASVVALVLGNFGYFNADRYIAYGMLVVLAIATIEILVNFVLDFYRPRVEGIETHASYDSRLLGLMSEPRHVLKAVADTLDYQFGFRVSQTWFYQFLEQMVAPFALFLILALWALTCFVIVGPDERGVLERYGRFHKAVEPGMTFKLPWPIDKVHRFTANETKTLALGHAGEREMRDKILWTAKHYKKEYETLVAAETEGLGDESIPVSLLVASMPRQLPPERRRRRRQEMVLRLLQPR